MVSTWRYYYGFVVIVCIASLLPLLDCAVHHCPPWPRCTYLKLCCQRTHNEGSTQLVWSDEEEYDPETEFKYTQS